MDPYINRMWTNGVKIQSREKFSLNSLTAKEKNKRKNWHKQIKLLKNDDLQHIHPANTMLHLRN